MHLSRTRDYISYGAIRACTTTGAQVSSMRNSRTSNRDIARVQNKIAGNDLREIQTSVYIHLGET